MHVHVRTSDLTLNNNGAQKLLRRLGTAATRYTRSTAADLIAIEIAAVEIVVSFDG